MFCSIRTCLQIIRKTHLVCILSIILSIFKVQLDFSPKEVKQLYSGCTNVLDSHSLLDAYKNSYLKYLPKECLLFRLWFIKKRNRKAQRKNCMPQESLQEKVGGVQQYHSCLSVPKKCLNSNNIDQPSTVN